MAERFTITGPGWSAQMELAPTPERSGEAARRAVLATLDEDSVTRDLTVVHAHTVEVSITALGRSFRWRRHPDAATHPVVLALTRASESEEHRCAAGMVELHALVAQRQAEERLYQALGITHPESGSHIEVHAGGITVEGARTLPWDQPEQVVEAGFLAEVDGTQVRLTPEMERLDETGLKGWRAAWRRLAEQLNPGNPQIGGDTGGPSWLNLEVVEPGSVPEMSWRLSRDGSERFHLGAGALRVLLTEGSPYASDGARSIMVLQPIDISIERNQARLTVSVSADSRPQSTSQSGGDTATLTVRAEAAGSGWAETSELQADQLAPDPLGLAARLRADRSMPPPEAGNTKPDPEALWAALPVRDGWLQVPIPNLTEQLLVDAGQQPEAAPRRELVSSGAVVFGNRSARSKGQQAWSLIVNGTECFGGEWVVENGRLRSATVRVVEPSVVLDGMLWIATEPPSSGDALPDLSNWISGLRSEPLYAAGAAGRRHQSLIQFESHLVFGNRGEGSAELAGARLTSDVNAEALAALTDADTGVLSPEFQPDHRAVAWLRHPTQPMIQALPMTQTARPANTPAASRALFPFVAADESAPWSFEFRGGAGMWPELPLDQLRPAPAWTAATELAGVVLSSPGLVLEPDRDGSGMARFRYDMPALDERAALSTINEQAAPTPAALTPNDYENHWRTLSDLAGQAALEGVTGFAIAAPHGILGAEQINASEAKLENLAGNTPLDMDVTAELSSYPPRLSFAIADRKEQSAAGDGVLAIPTGAMNVSGETLDIVAGSASLRSNGVLRDQTGLGRAPSTADGDLIRTWVQPDGAAEDGFDLVSTLQPIDLTAAQDDDTWHLWFRDLPCQLAADTARFRRDGCPAALAGYEWRLNAGATIAGLDFIPLRLESLVLDGSAVSSVSIRGRLQLPLPGDGPSEIEGMPNAVIAGFSVRDGRLALTGLEAAEPDTTLVWPMRLVEGEVGGAPILCWTELELNTDGTLSIGHAGAGPQIDFFAFDELWSVQLSNPVVFPIGSPSEPITQAFDRAGAGDDQATSARATDLEIGLRSDGSHEAGLIMTFEAGGDITLATRVDLLQDDLPAGVTGLSIFGIELHVEGVEAQLTNSSLQVSWSGLPDAAGSVDVLPGFPIVQPGLPGYLAMTFETTPPEDGTAGFVVTHALAEALLHGAAPERPDPAVRQLCSGQIVLGYLARMEKRDTVWERSVEISGWINLLNHHTHPVVNVGENGLLMVPVLDDPIDPTLHRARILLSGHHLPIANGDEAGLAVNDSQDGDRSVWSIVGSVELWAVVEHTLERTMGQRRRFTVSQPVRLATPSIVADELSSRRGPATELGAGGFVHPDAADTIAGALAALDPETMLVTLDAAAWVDATPITRDAPPITIRRLPLGAQGALVAGVDDYTRGSADWVLLELPFIGTLAKAAGNQPFTAHPTVLAASTAPQIRAFAAIMMGHATEPQAPFAPGAIDRGSGRSALRIDAMELAARLTEDATRVLSRAGVPLQSVLASTADGPEGRGRGDRLAASLPAPVDNWLLQSVMAHGRAELPSGSTTEFDLSTGPDSIKRNLGRESRAQLRLKGDDWEWAPDGGLMFTGSGTTAHVDITNHQQGQSFTILSVVTPDGDGRAATVAVEGGRHFKELISIDVGRGSVTVDVGGSRLQGSVPDHDGPLVVAFSSSPRRSRAGGPRWGTLYIDGRKVDEGRHSGFMWTAGARQRPRRKTFLRLGAPAPIGSMVGVHHRIALFDRVLTDAELATYSAPPPARAVDSTLALATRIGSELFDRTESDVSTHPAVAVVALGSEPKMIVGPYLALDLQTLEQEGTIVEAESVELIAVGQGRRLRPVASRLVDGVADAADVGRWAAAVLERHAHLSPVAVIRRRQVLTNPAGDVMVGYEFMTVEPVRTVTRIGWRGHSLRADPADLQFREPHFGGHDMPDTARPQDLAPPLVTGVQPVRSEELGWSGLRLTTRHADAAAPTPSGIGDGWEDARWHALQHRVRFRTQANAAPSHFTAPPRRAEAATATAPPLPASLPAMDDETESGAPWQPIVPDAVRHLLAGNRPGARIELRSQLLRTAGGSAADAGLAPALPSGSVPVTHRMPRPLPLPAAHRVVSGAADGLPVGVSSSPVDTAHFDLGDGRFAMYRLDVSHPVNGTIDIEAWDGLRMTALVEGDQEIPTLPARIVLTDGADRVELTASTGVGGRLSPGTVAELRVRDKDNSDGAALELLRRVAPGSLVRLEIAYRIPGGDHPERRLVFPLRVAADRHLPLVMQPEYVRFEDPDYNQALATEAMTASGKRSGDVEFSVFADRSTYGPGSPLVIGVAAGPSDRTVELPPVRLARITPDGSESELLSYHVQPSQPGSNRHLELLSMAELAEQGKFSWGEGDRIAVSIGEATASIATLSLAVTERDPNPAPTSAYGLLRTRGDSGEVVCVRYAVGPRPAQVELVAPGDVFTGIVRRRAVFVWQDTVRADQPDVRYYVQKITAGGSTHVPELDEFFGEMLIA